MIATTWKDKQDTFMSRNGGMQEPPPKGVFSAEQMFVRSTDNLVRRVPLELGDTSTATWPRKNKDRYPNFLSLFHFLLSRVQEDQTFNLYNHRRYLGEQMPLQFVFYLSESRMCAFGVKVRERGVYGRLVKTNFPTFITWLLYKVPNTHCRFAPPPRLIFSQVTPMILFI